MAKRYKVSGDYVFDLIAQASEEVRREFFELLGSLVEDPVPGSLEVDDILPLRGSEDFVDSWTVPFDAALLVYSLYPDLDQIEMIDVLWVQE